MHATESGIWNLHLYPSTLQHESRMDRICAEIDAMGLFDRIAQVGVWAEGLAVEEPISERVGRMRLVGGQRRARGLFGKVFAALAWTIRVFLRFRRERVAVVNVHSVATLPLGVVMKWWHGATLIYDTHELETETVAARGPRKPLLRLLERILIGQADHVSVVGPMIAQWYADAYGIPLPTVVRNVPRRTTAPPAEPTRLLREKLGLPDDATIFLYQGVIGPGRQVRTFLEAFRSPPRGRHLVLMGFGPWEQEVRDVAARNPQVHLFPAVPAVEVLAHTSGADVGLCGMENMSLSQYYSLPNKLFEYLAAGVPVAAPDYPEIRRVIEQDACGWLLGPTESWAEFIARLDLAEVRRLRAGAIAGGRRHVWEAERDRLRGLYEAVRPAVDRYRARSDA